MITETYHFTSTEFEGTVILQYNTDGALVNRDVTGASLNAKQINWFNQSLPPFLKQFKDALIGNKKAKLTKIADVKVTFDMFWDRYNEKARSSKKKTQLTWNRLSQTQRDKAYNHIPIYERSIPNGIAKKYAETYLNAELWNN